ncbi:MAG: AAA family ATPase [bacterium]|nr:AAA family ATPase [bacterium]
MIFRRHIFSAVSRSINEYPITLITGARQVGKTTLVTIIERERGYKYVSFDDTELLASAKANPKKFIKEHPAPIIFDEVQKAKELFPEIEAIVNEVRRERGSQSANGMYILTGSQKFNLMKEVSESMSGRVSIIEMPPLSQAEIRNWPEPVFSVDNNNMLSDSEKRSLSDEDLYLSIVRGFYPARWEIEGKPIENYFSNYMKTYLDRDVSQLIALKDKVKFENLLRVLASLTGQEFIPDNIAKTIGVDKNTVNAWTNIAIAGDIVTLLSPYYETSINKRIIKRHKIYFNDTGFACYLLGIDSPKALRRSSFKGSLVETYIHNEIRKSYLNNGLEDKNMFFYRDNNQNEIDLILLRNGKLDFVECKSGKKFTRENIKAFSQLKNTSFEIGGQCIVCTAEEAYRISSNVYAYPVRCL